MAVNMCAAFLLALPRNKAVLLACKNWSLVCSCLGLFEQSELRAGVSACLRKKKFLGHLSLLTCYEGEGVAMLIRGGH